MRLAYLLGTHPAWSETFLAREREALASAGIELQLVALDAGETRDPACWYPPREVAWQPRLARLAATILAAGSPRAPAALRRLPAAAWLATRLRQAGIDALHAGWSNLPAQVAWMAWRLGGPGYTVAAHAADVWDPPANATEVFAAARGVTVCNRAAWRELRRRYPRLGSALVYLRHGLPPDEWPRRTARPADPPVVLAVGRLVPKKGFDTLIVAARELPAPHAVEILGDGPDGERLANLARATGAPVTLVGRVAPGEVAARLARASLLVLPSRVLPGGDRDGVANVLIEAMAVGVPVVTTTAGSAAEVVDHGRTGWLVPPDDPAALARAIGRLLGDEPLRRRLADAARRTVEQRYDLTRNAARMAAWLRHVHEG